MTFRDLLWIGLVASLLALHFDRMAKREAVEKQMAMDLAWCMTNFATAQAVCADSILTATWALQQKQPSPVRRAVVKKIQRLTKRA